MDTACPVGEDVDAEIDRLQRSVETLSHELTLQRRKHAELALDSGVRPPRLALFDERSDPPDEDKSLSGTKPRKKEVEARRFNGKESVNEYLLQFELTAKRNGWSEPEKATNLLCALDGHARNILSEVDDVECCSYIEVKQLLRNRFGPVHLTEVHEQALQELRLTKGQPIRELASETQRLAKLAYADFDAAARTRMAIKALTDAIPDKNAVFYIKDKSPHTVDEVCTLYERYRVLHGEDDKRSRNTVHVVRGSPENDAPSAPHLQQVITDAVNRLVEATGTQIGQLNAAVAQLVNTQPVAPARASAAPPPAVPARPPSTLSASAAPYRPIAQRPPAAGAPCKPCPRCKQTGHWARDCPAQPPTDACYSCGQAGHRYRDCPMSLNFRRPGPAPGPRPSAPGH